MKSINISSKITQKDISNLQTAFKKLRIEASTPNETDTGTTRPSDGNLAIPQAKIRIFQEQIGLPFSSTLTPETITRLNVELEHIFYTKNKTRTANIHKMLDRVGLQIDPSEVKSRTFGESFWRLLTLIQCDRNCSRPSFISYCNWHCQRHFHLLFCSLLQW